MYMCICTVLVQENPFPCAGELMKLLVAIASANVALCQALHKCFNCVDLTHDGGDICQQTAQTCRHLLAIHVHLPCEVTVDD